MVLSFSRHFGFLSSLFFVDEFIHGAPRYLYSWRAGWKDKRRGGGLRVAMHPIRGRMHEREDAMLLAVVRSEEGEHISA